MLPREYIADILTAKGDIREWWDAEIPAHQRRAGPANVLSERQNIDPNQASVNANKSMTEDTINRAIAQSIRNRMFDTTKKPQPDKPPSEMTQRSGITVGKPF